MARKDPLRNFRFRLEINGIQQAGFSEVSGFDITVDPIDYREGSDPTHVRKLTGLTKYGNVTLKWGITDSMELYEWHRRIVDGTIDRKNIAIVAHSQGAAVVYYALLHKLFAPPCARCEPRSEITTTCYLRLRPEKT